MADPLSRRAKVWRGIAAAAPVVFLFWFAGIVMMLVAVLLHGVAASHKVHHGVALGLVVVAALDHLHQQISSQPWSQQFQKALPDSKQAASQVSSVLSKASGMLFNTSG